MNLTEPISGRIVLRQLPGGFSAMLGIVHLPQSFKPVESVAYLALTNDGTLLIADRQLDTGLPSEYQGFGVGSALTAPCWQKTSAANSLVVRFLKAFDESNGWIIFGPSMQPLVAESAFGGECHAWLDVADGRLQSIPAPAQGNGLAIDQLLTNLVVWPDHRGVLHCLPAIESGWRRTYRDYSLLQTRYGAGEITEKQLVETVRADPRLYKIRSLSYDPQYLKYLVALRDLSGIHEVRPMTADDVAARNLISRRALAQSMDEESSDTPAGETQNV